MNCLELHSVHKSFDKKEVLSDVSFTLKSGEILGLFGKNGSGKSTLLKILFGSLKADSIELSLNGNFLKPRTVIPKQIIGYLPQNHFLPKHLKVRDIIPMFCENGDAQDRIFRAPFIEKIAIRKAGTLSMGQLRYLELLLVGNLDHPFLLLDEPFSMIEPLYKEKIKEFLFSLKAKKGILLTDHYYEDVLAVSDRNLLLQDGSLREVQTANKLRESGYLR